MRRSRPLPARVRPCHQGLPTGDVNAAEWCAEAHTRLLRRYGSYSPRVSLQNGRPAPRGSVVETLVIDDHVGIAVEPAGQREGRDYLEDSFSRGRVAYSDAGLVPAEGKDLRGATAGVVLGAEFVEDSTLLGAERGRRRALAAIAWEIGRRAAWCKG